MVYVMHWAGDMPAGFFEFTPDGTAPPWAFYGYTRMRATTEAEASVEFKRALARYYDR
jgi:hypothetical protein